MGRPVGPSPHCHTHYRWTTFMFCYHFNTNPFP